MSLWILISVLLVLIGLGAVAFLTLLERKLLSLSQIRLGPNKVTLSGLLQPVADGVKLLFKEMFVVLLSQAILFAISPFLLLVLFIISWTWIIPWAGGLSLMKYSALVFFSLLGLSAYAVILTGWSSVSGFSKLGSLRGMLQSLSFEVAMILVFFICLVTFNSFMMESEFRHSKELLILWVPLWILLSLMETNRAPFDLLEGESELISGFNIEMGSLSFVFLFLSEYGMIMVLSLITTVGMFGSINVLSLLFFCFILFMRSCFPRVRYDIMMSFMWQGMLPISVAGFFFIFFVF